MILCPCDAHDCTCSWVITAACMHRTCAGLMPALQAGKRSGCLLTAQGQFCFLSRLRMECMQDMQATECIVQEAMRPAKSPVIGQPDCTRLLDRSKAPAAQIQFDRANGIRPLPGSFIAEQWT